VGTLHEVPDGPEHGGGHLTCPFCNSYDVTRLFLATVNIDSCECASCQARWDEDLGSGEYRGLSNRESVLIPRSR